MNDLFNKLLILRTPGIGPVKYAELIAKFGGLTAAAESLMSDQKLKDSVMREMDQSAALGIHYISDDDPRYPAALMEMKNHPPIITVRGNLNTLARPTVGIVGTRHATAAGLRFVSDLAQKFAEHGYAVVSGMAMGCDTAAHNGALSAPGDTVTIAVLAGGADYVWPIENERLYKKILERGCVISEMPVGFTPNVTHFARRNRLVSGMSQKLILGEADLKSGSMITARFAIECKRQVFAIPSHPSDARSVGPNGLIRDGLATICCGPDDFFNDTKQDYGHKTKNAFDPVNDIVDRLGIIPTSESVLAELVGKTIAEIKSDLVVLELQGRVRKCDGGYVKI